MQKPIISRLDQPDSYFLEIQGALSEDIDFSETKFPEKGTLTVQFEQLTKINSCGIRNWIKWIENKKPDSVHFIFRSCPKILIEQINVVKGIVPPGTIIESFYVPYYCEKDDIAKNILYKLNEDFEPTKVKQIRSVLCDLCQHPMELDAIENKYFGFLKLTV